MKLDAKIAVVTGGGRGIGQGISHTLLEHGAHLLIAQRQPLEGALACNERVAWVEADLATPGAPEVIAQAVERHFGGADILVNNAGIMFERAIEALSEAEWDRMLAINLRAPVFLAKALLEQMRRRGGGSIINVGSIEGIGANPWHTAYCASKAGLHGLTRALAVDLGRDGIRCNAVAPGWINSDLSQAYVDAQANPAQARHGLLGLHPVGRTGEPADVGGAVAFLASDDAAFVTGQVLVVDGGRTAKLPLPF
ncbi:SDR family NAD(P)-dependent oxidoreductase [Pseudomonas sp. KNUC1026]|uniref:SDR family NAD(P)-dependent oxidoreductase n=1 Tax=Pseudomonas sp. KNUC1026 TaxID=2893890 RepID=UPI001F41D9BD|nr:SDR family oxidoreductase [Pseudomonas sp. KNUC1026]UFH50068.1 SDR family oxidoreductase [Pseudomonas sp. KNUC1026]